MAKAESLYLQGTEAYRQGNFDAALAACDSLLAQSIEAAALAAVLNLKALSLAGKGLMFEAADCIGQAIQKRTDDALLDAQGRSTVLH